MRKVGTVVRGIRTPIIKANDDLKQIVIDSLMSAKESENYEFHDKDIVAITEAVVAISENNYVTVDDIKEDILKKNKNKEVGLLFPILSRNRFSLILKAIARAMDKIYLQLSFPCDEVGNGILDEDDFNRSGFNLGSLITEEAYDKFFGNYIHPFTGINMKDFYKELIESEDCEVEFIFSNDPKTIATYTNDILVCEIHNREKTKELLSEYNVYTLCDVMNKRRKNKGYNPTYGLLGSNKATEEKLKLFPRNGNSLVNSIQKELKKITGKNIEVMVYGDGAFKDPVGGIWELADPVVSPAYTKGLKGTPNELKLKYLSDNKFKDLKGEELVKAMKKEVKRKQKDLKGTMLSQGTTPRRIVDLIGSLSDLTSGSGDKGTPVVFIQGYFDNYSND